MFWSLVTSNWKIFLPFQVFVVINNIRTESIEHYRFQEQKMVNTFYGTRRATEKQRFSAVLDLKKINMHDVGPWLDFELTASLRWWLLACWGKSRLFVTAEQKQAVRDSLSSKPRLLLQDAKKQNGVSKSNVYSVFRWKLAVFVESFFLLKADGAHESTVVTLYGMIYENE